MTELVPPLNRVSHRVASWLAVDMPLSYLDQVVDPEADADTLERRRLTRAVVRACGDLEREVTRLRRRELHAKQVTPSRVDDGVACHHARPSLVDQLGLELGRRIGQHVHLH